MRKLIFATFVIAAMFGTAFAQEQQQSNSPQSADASIPNRGRAPDQPGGIGRLDLRVVDEEGAPIRGVYAYLESFTRRISGADKKVENYQCDTWDWTDARGVVVPGPIRMGRLVLTLKANGYQTQMINVLPTSLAEPVRVTMIRKK